MNQGRAENRSLDETLGRAWQALAALPRRELTMLPDRGSSTPITRRPRPGGRCTGEASRERRTGEPARASRCRLAGPDGSGCSGGWSRAQRGADLLDRKLRILRGELSRLRDAAAQAAGEWDRRQADAEQWLLRAVAARRPARDQAGRRRGIADVTVTYRTVMGVRHPAGTSCVIPGPGTWDGPVLAGTRQAHRAALAAAARHAAAAEALRLIEAETRATRIGSARSGTAGSRGLSRPWPR